MTSAQKLLALTFDDGPSQWTEPILDVLGRHGARATFFVIGEAIEGREEVVRRTSAAGHELGNHTWSHPELPALPDHEVRGQLERCSEALEQVAGSRPRLFRPPYFGSDSRVDRLVAEAGLGAPILATCTPGDWNPLTATQVAARVLAHHRAVICLHDGIPTGSASSPTREPTVGAVELLVPALLAEGYALVTVSELSA